MQYFFDVMRNQTSNKKHLLELIKRKSEVHEKIMKCKPALNFDQLKTLSENFKPMRV